MSYQNYLRSADDLVTPYEETRAGFIKLALEKNRQATPYIEEAKALKVAAALIHLDELRPAILTAAGISDKAAGHLREDDKLEAIRGLIEAFLEPAGRDFVDELVYRFLLTRGDALGGRMRNLAGVLAERKMTRTMVATLAVQGRNFLWLSSRSQSWMPGDRNDPDIEPYVRGLHWVTNGQARTVIYNVTVPVVRKNVDLSLLHTTPDAISLKRARSSAVKIGQNSATQRTQRLHGEHRGKPSVCSASPRCALCSCCTPPFSSLSVTTGHGDCSQSTRRIHCSW